MTSEARGGPSAGMWAVTCRAVGRHLSTVKRSSVLVGQHPPPPPPVPRSGGASAHVIRPRGPMIVRQWSGRCFFEVVFLSVDGSGMSGRQRGEG